ncbi:MAG TPA: AMP-binding protein, partial [Gemmataceae bacterium]|nr:AMP-binding protein [Gemmataceae bacterium]
MNGLMMPYPLTTAAILRRAETLHGHKEIVSRLCDKSFHRYTYHDAVCRAKKLAVALLNQGIQPGDRVATLCWNHYQHLEAYLGVTTCGAVIHTLNPRLHADDLAYIVNDAGDKFLLVDAALLPLLDTFRDRVKLESVIVIGQDGEVPKGMVNYEQLLADAHHEKFAYPNIEENQAAAMCYT